jgi:glycosyltransferase involved in cell wall biosynthesis
VGITFSDLFKNYKKKRDKLIPLLIRILYPYADKIIANSQNVARDLEKVSKIPQNKIQVIYNPKFIEEIKEKSKAHKVESPKFLKEKFTILAVGRLEKQKNFKTLIEAFALVKQKIDAQLIILGDGGQKKELERLIFDLGLEDIYLKGFTDNPYLYMANSDVFVSTSLWEGFSNSLIEAGILGLPIIATDCGSGSRELLMSDFGLSIGRQTLNKPLEKGNIEYAENGILVARQDPEKMAEAILVLAGNDKLREKYSQNIKKQSEKFEIKTILEKIKFNL